MSPGDDDALVAWLGQLALVEVGALVAGAEGERRALLIRAHVGELEAALAEARVRADVLRAALGEPGPLALVAGPRPGAPAALAARLRTRADAARGLARIEDAAAAVLPRLDQARRGA